MTYLSGRKFSSFSIFFFPRSTSFLERTIKTNLILYSILIIVFRLRNTFLLKINYVSTLYNTFCICTKINFILFEITSRSTLCFLINHVLRFCILCKLLKVNTSIVFLVLCHQRKNDGYFVILEVFQKAYHVHA